MPSISSISYENKWYQVSAGLDKHIYIYIYIYICIYMCVCVYIYIYIYVYMLKRQICSESDNMIEIYGKLDKSNT